MSTNNPKRVTEWFRTGQKKIVLELLTAHGTLASPDTINYILSKEEPEQYIENILKNFHEMPLFLTVDQLKAAESSSDVKLEIFVEEKSNAITKIFIKNTINHIYPNTEFGVPNRD